MRSPLLDDVPATESRQTESCDRADIVTSGDNMHPYICEDDPDDEDEDDFDEDDDVDDESNDDEEEEEEETWQVAESLPLR
jgi:hypothetical protein